MNSILIETKKLKVQSFDKLSVVRNKKILIEATDLTNVFKAINLQDDVMNFYRLGVEMIAHKMLPKEIKQHLNAKH